MKLQLAHKVLLVIAVPVIFQLGFTAYFTGFLTELDRNQVQEQQAAEAGFLRDQVYVLINQRMLLYGMYRATNNPEYLQKYRENDDAIQGYFRRTAEVWQNDQKKMAALTNSWGLNLNFSRLMTLMMKGDKQDDVSGLLGGALMRTVLKSHLDSSDYYNHGVETLFLESEAEQASAAQQIRATEASMKFALLSALAVSILLAVGSGLFFSRSITRRLQVVLANIKSMVQGNADMMATGGADEITALNKAVIDTADKIRREEDFQAQTTRIVAQELQRPLESVSAAFTEMRTSGFEQLSPKGQVRLDQSDAELARLQGLVKDLLLLDGIRDVGWDLKVHQIDLADAARLSVEIVADLARAKQVEISSRLQSTAVLGDPDRIVQVAVNLLSNAIKFAPKGSTVEIETSMRDGLGRLSVTDRGPGISPEFQTTIFGRFEQESSQEAEDKGGSGLGLAISKLLIEAQNGEMGFSSEIGSGSTFWLSVPGSGGSTPKQSSLTAGSTTAGHSWTPTLWYKGLALVSLPLLVQVVAIAVIWLSMSSMTANLLELKAARQMAHIHARLVNEIARSTFYALLFNDTHDPDIRKKVTAEHKLLNDMAAQLRAVTRDHPQLNRSANQLQDMVNDHIALQNDIVHAEQNAKLARWFAPPNAERTERLLTQMQGPLDEAIAYETSLAETRALANGNTRKTIETVLFCSAVLTALVSAGMGLFMIRRLTMRTRRVVANTVRLANREPLEPPLPGNDEIAFVDNSVFDAAKRLGQVEHFKQQLVSITSHELRTPLSSLLAMCDLIGGGVFGTLTTSGKTTLHGARKTIADLTAMITNLLDTEKINSGKMLVTKSEVELDSILDDAAANIKDLARMRRIEVRTDRSGLEAAADARRLVQALTAVLSEITDQAPQGSTIALESIKNGDALELRVTAPMTILVGETNRRARERLAVDLSRLIAEQHGGTMEISSSERQSVFSIKLPSSNFK